MEGYSKEISAKLGIPKKSIYNTIKLLEEGSTIPFISRYRKEATGNLDETSIQDIEKEAARLRDLDSRRETILAEIARQGKLTSRLKESINEADSLIELEDLYLPYKPKRKTKADKAKTKGLEPLAEKIRGQDDFDVWREAENFLNDKVKTAEEVLQGARHIISEWINEDKRAREAVRSCFKKGAVVSSRAVKEVPGEATKYRDYFDYREPLSEITSHRFLAIKRGHREGYLRLSVLPEEEGVLEVLEEMYLKAQNQPSGQVKLAVKDCYRRLLSPSIETEFINQAKEAADTEAIKVFAQNLRQLLLAPVLGPRRILALDPGFRTGCKAVCLNEQGDLMASDTVYPHPPVSRKGEAEQKIKEMVKGLGIEAIAIGNGTAGRETRQFIDSSGLDKAIKVFMVSEAGASIYSASEAAREEFPDQDVTVRGAVSIGRRLADPLAELVKIDPKSIGVGQYQHDVDQARLKDSLQKVVESCVNQVGVNLNTASKHLLVHVSGLGPKIAKNIIDYRAQHGPFESREDLKKVPKLGEKVFEQCAGFLRIEGGKNPLDNSAVHPESYYIVEKIAGDLGINIEDLAGGISIGDRIDLSRYVDDRAGLPTLKDIISELAKPGRDPRDSVEDFEFEKGIASIEDLEEGMVLKGIITNITNFGAFVDIGIKNNGLIHVSELSNRFVINPQDVVSIHQKVEVKIIGIDLERKRIALSMKELA
ncbi:MAG: Tex family protein [Actinomycetota bacterium]